MSERGKAIVRLARERLHYERRGGDQLVLPENVFIELLEVRGQVHLRKGLLDCIPALDYLFPRRRRALALFAV